MLQCIIHILMDYYMDYYMDPCGFSETIRVSWIVRAWCGNQSGGRYGYGSTACARSCAPWEKFQRKGLLTGWDHPCSAENVAMPPRSTSDIAPHSCSAEYIIPPTCFVVYVTPPSSFMEDITSLFWLCVGLCFSLPALRWQSCRSSAAPFTYRHQLAITRMSHRLVVQRRTLHLLPALHRSCRPKGLHPLVILTINYLHPSIPAAWHMHYKELHKALIQDSYELFKVINYNNCIF